MAHEHFRKIFICPGATSLEMSITRGLTHMCRRDCVSVLLCFHLIWMWGKQELCLIPMPTMNNRDPEGKPAGVYQPRVFCSTWMLFIPTLFFFCKKDSRENNAILIWVFLSIILLVSPVLQTLVHWVNILSC